MDNFRKIPRAVRELVFARSGGVCQYEGCDKKITVDTFHASHLRARANGGIDDPSNLEAWCQECNLRNQSRDVRDPRVKPRAWQSREIDQIVRAIVETGAATLSAAPGAGKTIFAGLVFEALQEIGHAERIVVFTPRVALVDQWRRALVEARHIELKPNHEVERPGQHGTVSTYQSLSRETVATHQTMARRSPTLLVLDEVHHVGKHITKPEGAWARFVGQMSGGLDGLAVAGVLNLSGTMWRSNMRERISTVRYITLADGRIETVVDGQVTVEELIHAKQLRPLDFYRHNAKVKLQDLKNLEYIEANLADLDEQPSKAAVRHLGSIAGWRQSFVAAVLDRLEAAHRALQGYHAKALIVCFRQEHAVAFAIEVDRQMRERGFPPLAVCATSNDGKDAQRALEDFREQKRSGVLCTVDMAGEGYDCPEIAVIGYASSKLTALYVRQVMARAMRVTEREREMGHVIPAAIVLPDSQPLVEKMLAYLVAYVPDLDDEPGPPGPPGHYDPRFSLEDVAFSDDNVSIADGGREDMSGALVRRVAATFQPLGIPEVWAPRFIVAARRVGDQMDNTHPFDQPAPEEKGFRFVGGTRGKDTEDRAQSLQDDLKTCAGWWEKNGDPDIPIARFQFETNKAGSFGNGGRKSASVNQLQAAWDWAAGMIRYRCSETGTKVPPCARGGSGRCL